MEDIPAECKERNKSVHKTDIDNNRAVSRVGFDDIVAVLVVTIPIHQGSDCGHARSHTETSNNQGWPPAPLVDLHAMREMCCYD